MNVKKKYGNLIMSYVDDVMIATPTREDHIERLQREAESGMKKHQYNGERGTGRHREAPRST